jgi:hypothetical protein
MAKKSSVEVSKEQSGRLTQLTTLINHDMSSLKDSVRAYFGESKVSSHNITISDSDILLAKIRVVKEWVSEMEEIVKGK